jgi:hypothetical protein
MKDRGQDTGDRRQGIEVGWRRVEGRENGGGEDADEHWRV